MSDITRDQFIDDYTMGQSGDYRRLNVRGRFAIPCVCGETGCRGWQMAHADQVEKWLAGRFTATTGDATSNA